jgi:NADH:ubiquinone oxidoreductase subunit 3 (subunit A)
MVLRNAKDVQKRVKRKLHISQIAVSVICLAGVVFNLTELLSVRDNGSQYPFEAESFSHYSVYASKATYILYLLSFTVFLLLMCWSVWKRKWKAFRLFLMVNFILAVYPLITSG